MTGAIVPLASRRKGGKALAALRADRSANARQQPRDGAAGGAERASILQTLDHDDLLGRFFSGPSWDGWPCVLRATFGLPMTGTDRARFRQLADRDSPPGPVREAWFAIGRRYRPEC